jgi:hypothetical protein
LQIGVIIEEIFIPRISLVGIIIRPKVSKDLFGLHLSQ